jgi:uncharacterized protein
MGGSAGSTKKIATFLILTVAISLPFWLITIATEELASPLLFAPMLAAMITRYIYQRNVRDLGWRLMKTESHPRWWQWANVRYLALGYVLPPAIGGVVYGFTWIVVSGSFSTDDGVKDVMIAGLSTATALVLFLGVLSIGEEIGWRGFLFPELANRFNFLTASVVGGVVWGLWHYPLIIFASDVFDFGALPLYFALPMFTLTFIPVTAVMGWLQLKTGSVWPAVLMHGSHNAITLSFFNELTSESGAAPYIAGEVGVGLLAAWGAVVLFVWRRQLKGQISP